jgi:hypothetical protein
MARPDIRIQGANELAKLSKQLRDAGNKGVQRSMRKRLRDAAKPVLLDVKIEAGQHSVMIPKSIVLQMKYTERNAGAYIKAQASRMPKGKESLPRLFELGSKGSGGRYIRHPVFARRAGHSRVSGRKTYENIFDRGAVVWVKQPTHPFLIETVNKHAKQLRRDMLQVLDDVKKDLNA